MRVRTESRRLWQFLYFLGDTLFMFRNSKSLFHSNFETMVKELQRKWRSS